MKYLLTLILVTFSVYANAQIQLEFEKDSMGDQPEIVAIPDSRGFVNDRARTFTDEQTVKLMALMRSLKMDSTQITVLTMSTIEPFESFDDLTTHYANTWKLGAKKKNGVMIAFSKELKKSRILVGEGLQSKLTPEVLKGIDNIMIPEFKNGLYFTGTVKAVKKINEYINQK